MKSKNKQAGFIPLLVAFAVALISVSLAGTYYALHHPSHTVVSSQSIDQGNKGEASNVDDGSSLAESESNFNVSETAEYTDNKNSEQLHTPQVASESMSFSPSPSTDPGSLITAIRGGTESTVAASNSTFNPGQVLGLTTIASNTPSLQTGTASGASQPAYFTFAAPINHTSSTPYTITSVIDADTVICDTCTVNSSLNVLGTTSVTGTITASALTISGDATLPVLSISPTVSGVTNIGSSTSTLAEIYAQKINTSEIIGLGDEGSAHVLLNPYGAGNVGIGTSSPSQQLEITKNFAMPATALDGSAGVIYQAGSRLLHTRTCTGAVSSLYFGYQAGNFTSCGASPDYNTGVGAYALTALTTGTGNTAVGGYSLAGTTTGSENTAVGAYTASSITGSRNVAVGHGALAGNQDGNDNIAIGAYAMIPNTSGSGNVAIGNSGFASFNTTGNQNVYLGYYSGMTSNAANKNNTGNYNTYLGALTGPSVATQLSKAVAIGYNALAGASNAFILGGTGADAVNVGINTTTPDTGTRLHVVGNQRIDGGLCVRNATACPSYSAGRLYVDTAGTVGGDDPGDVFDIAELYAADSVSPGDVVMTSPNGKATRTTEFGEIEMPAVTKTNSAYNSAILGVVSTRPAIVMAGHFVITGPEGQKENADIAQVALVGRVPVKVTLENGPIKAGDFLTSSKLYPGYAMKATESGQVIGIALEDFSSSLCHSLEEGNPCDSGSTLPAGKVLVFVNPGYQLIDNKLTNLASADPASSALVINQEGTGDILTLQSSGINRLLVKNDGSVEILAEVNQRDIPIFSITNNQRILLSVTQEKFSINTLSVELSKNSAGTARINLGDTETLVTFDKPYSTVPKISVSVQNVPALFAVTKKTKSSFTIKLKNPAIENIDFDWFAFEQPENTLSESKLILDTSALSKATPIVEEEVKENTQTLEEEKKEVESQTEEKSVQETPSDEETE